MKPHFDRHVLRKRMREALAAGSQPTEQPIVTPGQVTPAPIAEPVSAPMQEPVSASAPPAAKPARTAPRTDVMRIVVPWSNCASIPLWQLWLQEAEPESPVHDWVPITPALPLWSFVHPRAQGLSPPS